jgi:hypothetical protein
MGSAAIGHASPQVGVNLFPHFRAKSPQRIAPPPVEPPGLPQEEETKPANMVIPIQVSDVEYALLMRALCPTGTHVPEDLPVDVSASNVPGVVDGADEPPPSNLRIVPPDRPPGTPIV